MQWCFGWDRIYYTSEAERNLLIKNKKININIENYKKPGKGRREGGLVYINRDIFNRVGGYNEWIEELGGPDNDIAHRLCYLKKYYEKFPNIIIHLWHPRDIDKYKSTRKWNVKIMKETFTKTNEVIKFLVNKQRGQISYPLCDFVPFMNLFNKNKDYRDINPEEKEKYLQKWKDKIELHELKTKEELNKQIKRPAKKSKKVIRELLKLYEKKKHDIKLKKEQVVKEILIAKQNRQWEEIKKRREKIL